MKDFKTFAKVRAKDYWDRIIEYHKKHEKDLGIRGLQGISKETLFRGS